MEMKRKIIVIVDIEGIIGIRKICDINQNVRLAYRELKMLIIEVQKYGWQDVYICNIHDDGTCLEKEVLEGMGYIFVNGLNELCNKLEDFGYGMMVGFHGKRDSGGMFDHTFRDDIRSVECNGKEIGEVGMFYKWLSEKGVQVVFISGEGYFADEIDNKNCIIHSMISFGRYNEERERFLTRLRKAMVIMKGSLINNKPEEEKTEVRLKLCSEDVYYIMKGNECYKVKTDYIYFESVDKFFREILEFCKELNKINRIIYKNNLEFISHIKENGYTQDELQEKIGGYLNYNVEYLNYKERNRIATELGMKYEDICIGKEMF